MLIYSKKVEDEIRLFGTLKNIPSEDDAQLIYTDAENVELENRPTLDDTYLDNGKGGIIQKSTGEEIKVFIDTTNVIPGDGSEPVPPAPVGNPYLTFSSDEPFSISTNNQFKSWDGTIEYSTDTENWTEWGGTEINSSEDAKLYFRGSNNSVISYISSEESPNYWTLNGNAISCTGNIENLLDYQTVANGEHPQMGIGCFTGMFRNCTSLTTAPELPATTLTEGCYNNMFSECTALTITPQLPATTLANYCYNIMFSDCTSLTTIPELPATTLTEGCYDGMFQGCTALTAAPQLPATTLADYCYEAMFSGCTSLTTVPALPATTLAEGCYSGMFFGCTSLTTAPELPATTLAGECYSGMFQGCASLTTAPELSATTLANYCYDSMFNGCTSLKLSITQTADYTTAYRIPKEGTGIDAQSALNNMFANTGGTFTGIPTINTTYYLHKDNHIV